jgi:uncharacterized protein YcaQ
MPAPTLVQLRAYAVARSLFAATTLPRAIAKLGFVQADPIRAPARAQDLMLRHRVAVDAHFAHGKVKNWFGGSTNASTQLLDGMHYRGLVRIARRDGGVRVYAARDSGAPAPDPAAALDTLVDVVVQK